MWAQNKQINNYLFFRTDRIGDFLVSAILLKSIKRNNKHSLITVICSENNFPYIKSFEFIDEVISYPTSYLKKVLLFFYLLKKKYNLVGVLDGKKKSIYFSTLLKSKHKILITGKKFYVKTLKNFYTKIFLFEESLSRIDEIKQILNIISFNYDITDQNLFEKREYKLDKCFDIQNNYLLFHFDEKWIDKDYIKEFSSIQPSIDEFIIFINKLTKKICNNVVISTGNINNSIIDKFHDYLKIYNKDLFFKKCDERNIYLAKNLNFFDLETLVKNSFIVITCHGAVTHLASSLNKKIIDIFDKSKKDFYQKWNKHIKNYSYIYRKKFDKLSFEILEKL